MEKSVIETNAEIRARIGDAEYAKALSLATRYLLSKPSYSSEELAEIGRTNINALDILSNRILELGKARFLGEREKGV